VKFRQVCLRLMLATVAYLCIPCVAPTASNAALGQLSWDIPTNDPLQVGDLFEESGASPLADVNTLASYASLNSPLPIYVDRVVVAKRERKAGPLVEEEIEENLNVYCQGDTSFTLRTKKFVTKDEEQIVYVELKTGGPESIKSITVGPAAEWNIKENNCNINYTVVGQTCDKLKIQFTATPNGTHKGTIQITFGGGAVLNYTKTLED
jgi:hypothetical protein